MEKQLDELAERVEALETKHEHHYHEKLYMPDPDATRTTLPLLDENCYVPDPDPEPKADPDSAENEKSTDEPITSDDERCRTCADLKTVIDERDKAYDEIDTLKETLRILRIEQGLLKESNSTYVREREDLRQDYLKASDRASKLEAANERLRDEVQDTLYCNEHIAKALEDLKAEVEESQSMIDPNNMQAWKRLKAELTEARERIERLEQGIRDALYHIRVSELASANAKLRAALKPAADLGRVDGEY
jgi:DNA repair exonuclease SbcCD ATPase subunit